MVTNCAQNICMFSVAYRGPNTHIFAFTDFNNNRFQKKLMMQNTIYEYSPLQLSTLPTLPHVFSKYVHIQMMNQL